MKFRVCKFFVACKALEILFFFVVLLSLRKEYYVRIETATNIFLLRNDDADAILLLQILLLFRNSCLSKLSSKSLREQIQDRPSERELFLLFLLEIRKREVSREHFLLFKIRESRPAQNEGETDERVPVLQNASRPRTGKPRRGPSVRRHRFHVVEVTVRVFTATFFPNLSLLFDRSVARKRWSQILASVVSSSSSFFFEHRHPFSSVEKLPVDRRELFLQVTQKSTS